MGISFLRKPSISSPRSELHDLGAKNPQLAQNIRDWFSRKQDGKPFSVGLERLYAELGALESLAHDGDVDEDPG